MADVPVELLIVGAALGAFLVLWGILSAVLRLPRFRRIPPDELLDDPSRAALLDMIRFQPGIRFQDLVERTRHPPHVVKQELEDLFRAGHIRRGVKDGHRVYAPVREDPRQAELVAEAGAGMAPRLLASLVEADAPNLRNLAARLGEPEERVWAEVARLRRHGLVEAPSGGAGRIAVTPAGRRASAEARRTQLPPQAA